MAKRLIITLIFLAAVIGAILAYDYYRISKMTAAMALQIKTPPIRVASTLVKQKSWQKQLHANGTLMASRQAQIKSEAAGLLEKVHFKSGQIVKKGDLLIEIRDDLEKANLKSAQAELSLAKLTYTRLSKLREKGVGSVSELDASKAKLQEAQAQVEQINALITHKNIVVPFDGQMGISTLHAGQAVSVGQVLAQITTLDPLEVHFTLPQRYLNEVMIGQPVQFTTDAYPNFTFTAKIMAIDPQIELSTRSVSIQATIKNPEKNLLPGMFVRLSVHQEQEQRVLLLPNTSIDYDLTGESVYILTPEKQQSDNKDKNHVYIAHKIPVTVGEKQGNDVIITNGLKPNTRVVTAGQVKLTEGARVITQ